jgi:glycosyl-4,4'-diaponeurosporenoate acyltransferase
MITINTIFWLSCCFGVGWFVHRLLPKSAFDKINYLFNEWSFEKRLYKIIYVARWKDKLPEWGSVWDFEKKHIPKELNLEYVERFILETHRAEIGHLGMAVLGFACVLVNPDENALMAIICSIINFVIQIPFCLIQRYNRPRLARLKLRLANKEHNKKPAR